MTLLNRSTAKCKRGSSDSIARAPLSVERNHRHDLSLARRPTALLHMFATSEKWLRRSARFTSTESSDEVHGAARSATAGSGSRNYEEASAGQSQIRRSPVRQRHG